MLGKPGREQLGLGAPNASQRGCDKTDSCRIQHGSKGSSRRRDTASEGGVFS